MSDMFSDFSQAIGKQREQNMGLMEKLLVAAQPGAVYSQPVSSGNYMVITASEVSAGGGFGGGLGFGTPSTDDEVSGDEGARPQRQESRGGGGGGSGGGGRSAGRPVAVIIIGPDGVDVKPVIDATKIALAALTTLGAMVMTLKRMRKLSRG